MVDSYDLIILGGGPAGLTAAIYAGRYNIKTLVIAKSFGGTANLAGEIENWPGFMGSGIELMGNFKEQAKKFGANFLEADIEKVGVSDSRGFGVSGKLFTLNVDKKIIYGKSLVIALGTENRKLNIPGEKEFLGKGVSYCATCDGNFFRGKNVAVVGGADSAAKAALYLSDICKKVHIIYRKHEMRCEPISLSKICKKGNIEIHYFSNPIEILGKNVVKGLKIKTDEPEKDSVESVIDVDGVFIEVGAIPAKEIVKSLDLEIEKDYIVTDKNAKTNVEGVFAAGDVTNNSLKQVVNAAGEGAVAAKGVHEYLMKK